MEISTWATLDSNGQEAVRESIRLRRSSASAMFKKAAWSSDFLSEWIIHTIKERKGTWVIGIPGALAEFPCRPGANLSIHSDREKIEVTTEDACFRLHKHETLHALVSDGNGSVVIAVSIGDAHNPAGGSFTFLGKDQRSIRPLHNNGDLFDFGFGSPWMRFCVRVTDISLSDKMKAFAGTNWSKVLGTLGPQIVGISPARVVESQFSRIEVFSPIPPPSGRSPAGAHTHLLPNLLDVSADTPSRDRLPSESAPVAVFYPFE